MRCYSVQAPGVTRYAGTNAQARATRRELATSQGCRLQDVVVEQVEIPTAKADLLAFINLLSAAADDVGG